MCKVATALRVCHEGAEPLNSVDFGTCNMGYHPSFGSHTPLYFSKSKELSQYISYLETRSCSSRLKVRSQGHLIMQSNHYASGMSLRCGARDIYMCKVITTRRVCHIGAEPGVFLCERQQTVRVFTAERVGHRGDYQLKETSRKKRFGITASQEVSL